MRLHTIILLAVVLGTTVKASALLGVHPYADNAPQGHTVIPLSRNGRINTYSVRENGAHEYEFTAVKVEDPVKKKPITGEVELY